MNFDFCIERIHVFSLKTPRFKMKIINRKFLKAQFLSSMGIRINIIVNILVSLEETVIFCGDSQLTSALLSMNSSVTGHISVGSYNGTDIRGDGALIQCESMQCTLSVLSLSQQLMAAFAEVNRLALIESCI